jgi:D-cysteine desulfhydrase/L-cysteate sulfo-lyase
MTMAGLVLGLKHLGCRARVVGVSAESKADKLCESVVDFAQRAAQLIGLSTVVEAEDFDVVDDQVKTGYGVVTAPIVDTIRLVARQHGMVLDPVYNGKTMLSLRDHVHSGRVTSDHTVVFINTGGTPALFAHNAELMAPGAAAINEHSP